MELLVYNLLRLAIVAILYSALRGTGTILPIFAVHVDVCTSDVLAVHHDLLSADLHSVCPCSFIESVG
ncbi:hypothetical protein DPMN_181144 [Dreissena polymorpha]|uniref:Uncharacterized protein n=1 Tax=Dreissena polymorpha TaxID=45954 RepID=A0A9D4DDW0_DREPO|nr:hypothetical protein DPMN_181144 [Dreissena polymorpha]